MSTESFYLGPPGDQVDSEPEVELISLTTEKLPHYKLRSDYSVRFSGYQHSDFNRAEQVKENISQLTNDQIHQTLEYFIICGLRVNKMTETYEDCQALTLLVQEQRSHLDLAANIGLNLVEKNTQLEQRVISLEEQLESYKETMKQLKHQLSLKDDLLRMFHSEIEESEDQSSLLTEPTDTGFILDKVNVRQLETKLSRLEEENIKLRDQQLTLTTNTDLLETKETQLVNDCITHILESTKTIDRLSVDLNKKTNDYLNQHEEISRLLTSKIDLENKTHHLLTENDNLITQLRDHQTKEFTLTKEIADIRDRYDECINLLNEKQDEIRVLKKKIERMIVKQVQYYSLSSPEPDLSRSLATELEESCKRGAEEMDHSRTMRIMEQARILNTVLFEADDETSSGFTEDIVSSVAHTEICDVTSPNQLSGNFLLRRSIQEDCERRRLLRCYSASNRNGSYRTSSSTVTPCTSPTNDSDNYYLTQAMFHHQSSCNGLNSLNTNIISRTESPTSSQNMYKFPDKLQLIKPLEGSQTLRAWQNLATPSLTKALFEDQPHGVCYRGQQMPVTSPLLSPNSDSSRSHDDHRAYTSSDCDDVDYEEPAATVRAKQQESHSNTFSYSHSKMLNTAISPDRISARDLVPCNHPRSIDYRSSSPHSSCDTHDSTPVNERDLESMLPLSITTATITTTIITATNHRSSITAITHNYTPASWLDRFTVGSIMTSILGHTRPISSSMLTSASTDHHPYHHHPRPPTVTTTPSYVTSESSLIGRLTNLPPLAKRKPLQRHQSGLNLLTSLASCSDTRMAFHRVDSVEGDEVVTGVSGRGQVD